MRFGLNPLSVGAATDNSLFCKTCVFADPDRVDQGRANAAEHLAFGGGVHHRLGAPLARVQLQEAVTGLVRR